MAVLVPNDWRKMDVSSTTNPRQRSPANDHSTPLPQLQQQLPAYTYPLQQQPQGGWTPSIAAAPFYPSHFQNPHHQQSSQPFATPIPHQFPYFDPANAQFAAQWAYQRMMFNAQPGFPPMQPPQHRTASNSSSSNDYFPQNQAPFNPFPSGTPPPRSPSGDHPQGPQQQQPSQNGPYAGFHPYRRPNRQNTHASDTSDKRPSTNLSPFPPYARPDATGSTSSISSTSSQRQRTSSNQSVHSSHNSPSANGSARSRPNGSVPSRNTPSSATSSGSSPLRIPHHRNTSSSSSGSTATTTTSSRPPALAPTMSATTTSTTSTSAVAISGATATPRPARPSPLSQGNFTAADKRMSRDDSDLATMLESSQASSSRSGGLKGRLRRALSFNVLREDETPESSKASNSKLKSKSPAPVNNPVDGKPGSSGEMDSGVDDGASTATVQAKKKSRTASLFNSRINASTDNISLSSTVSSASVMIRKLGSMGKLARRNSLAGITSLFKDKDKDKDKEKEKDKDGDKKGKKDKKISSAKAGASEASVSHVTAELDRISNGDWAADLQGLSPAAKLARQHTLKSNAEAAAKAKAQQEAQVAAATAAAVTESPQVNGMSGVPAWEGGTTTRQSSSPVKPGEVKVNEDGTKVLVEDDEEDSDDGHYNPNEPGNFSMDGWDDDEDWDVDPDGEEDLTIRAAMESTHIETDVEPWAVGVRRSLERTKRPSKGILKNPGKYDQEAYHTDQPAQVRARSNSYNSHPGPPSELGPLARIPSPDPDHIDGLHRHNAHSSGHGNASPSSSLQPPSLVSSPPTALSSDSSKKFSDLPLVVPHPSEKSIFQHPALNSSAPTLSLTMASSSPSIPHRSATSPAKRLAFANNLSVYDTFSSAVYDRRSEPATWSRLTPVLAQRIKEELNSYKMEEMEVHAASRIHTQFFV